MDSPNDWTLESELCKLAGATSATEAIAKLRLLDSPPEDSIVRRDTEWRRSGAETYSYRFWLGDALGVERGFLLKACVAFSPAQDLKSLLDSWVERRLLLADNGITTPRMYFHGSGVVLEELIAFGLAEVLQPTAQRAHLLVNLAELAGVLSRLGFAPIDAYSDLRSHGSDVVAVDFGEDLGPPAIAAPGEIHPFNQLLATLRRWAVTPDADQLAALTYHFRTAAASEPSRPS